MTNFVLLFNGGGMPETEEERAAVMAAWGAWYEALGANLVDGGAPLLPVANTITSEGVTAGVGGTPPSGYTIISADSLAEATEMGKGCPILTDGGQVSVFETMPM